MSQTMQGSMSYIPLEKHLPGITGLLEYRQDTGAPIRELTQILLRGESTLTEGERELIATVVSHGNECRFCTAAHTAAVNVLLEEDQTSEAVKQNIDTAPVSDKLKALLHIAASVQKSGRQVTPAQIETARAQGATDREIHDTVLIAALFSLYNRYVDGLATVTPTDPAFYQGLGMRLKLHGYNRLPQGYDHLKNKRQYSQSHMSSTSASAILEPGTSSRTKPGSLAALFAICFISSLFGGVVSTLMSVYLPVAAKDLFGTVSEDQLDNVRATINSIFIFGWMFGGVIWGLVCDRIGRARTVMLSTLCYGVFTVLTATAPSWWLVAGCRLLSGFGVGGVLVTTTMLVSESWTGKGRAVALGILSISIPIGIFSAGLIHNLLPQWRLAFLTGAIPLLAAGAALFLLKEPADTVTRQEDRLGFLAVAHRKNLVTGSVIFGAMLIGMWVIFEWLPSWVQSLNGSTDAQRGISMMLMGAGGLAGGFVSGWVVHALGLRRTMILCFAICFGMSFLLFQLNHSFNGVAYAEVASMAVFFGISQGSLSVYIPELFPKAIGAAATGFCFNVGRLFTATAVFFAGALVTLLGGYGNALFIFSFIFLIGLLATAFAGKK